MNLKNVTIIGVSAIVFAMGSDCNVFAAEVAGKRLTKMPEISQERKVVDTMRQLGFSVESARRLGNGDWEIRVNGFDGKNAKGAFRGAIVTPVTNVEGMRSAAASKAGMAGSRGAAGPRGGGTRSEQDGSATGGNSGPEGSSGSGRGGGPLPANDKNEDGSATGGGRDGGVNPGTNPRGHSSALHVTVASDGALQIDSSSLRQAGFANSVGKTANGQVTFR
ncbi:MAG: hypothetical protein IPQ16_13880 [Geobacteraceae bacterium]|nr:hypothetical protein [Geobacteraceae bacterium]